MKVLDLFCGCGGMTQGLKNAGFDIICGIDFWDKAISSYKLNQDHLALCKDLTKYSPKQFSIETKINKIDLLVGGPPCQGFSILGKRDQADPRNSLFKEYVKYLEYFKPIAFIMENVIGILSMKTSKGINVIDIIMKDLSKYYNCVLCKLYASDFGVPQNRRRVIIFGIRKDLNIIPEEPIPRMKINNRIPLKTVLEKRSKVDPKYFLNNESIRKILLKNKISSFKTKILDINKPSPTITAHYRTDGIIKYKDNKYRRLTILELKRIQTFPDKYKLVGNEQEKIKQIGNAVPPRFASFLGSYINKLLIG